MYYSTNLFRKKKQQQQQPITTQFEDHSNIQYDQDQLDQPQPQQPIKRSIRLTTPSDIYNISPSFEVPYILKNAIDQLDTRYFQDPTFRITGSITKDGVAYSVLPSELFIWSLDKPQNCDRLEIPHRLLNQYSVAVYRTKSNSDKFSAFYCTSEGSVRYWADTNRPNHTQDISLDFPNHHSVAYRVFITECQPYGVVIGNSQGGIHLVSLRHGVLTSKKINKAQGMLSYLYLARQSPVVSVSSSSSSSQLNNTRSVFVLTESSLYKYEIANNTEKIVLDYSIQRDLQKLFYDIPDLKIHQIYLDNSKNLQQKNEEQESINIILYQQSQYSTKYYLATIDIQENQVSQIKRIDSFLSRRDHTNNDVNSVEPNFYSTQTTKYFLTWRDTVFFTSVASTSNSKDISGEIKIQDHITGSGVYNNNYYIINIDGVHKINVVPFITSSTTNTNVDSQMTDDLVTGTNKNQQQDYPIIFDIPQEEDIVGGKRNIILKTLNAISLKQQNKIKQSIELCKRIEDLDLIIQQVSIFIVDQQPISKFWADDSGKLIGTLGSEISVQLKQQLEDKKKRHAFFINSLKEYGLWNQLNKSSTVQMLEKNDVKIQSAIELREYQNLHLNPTTTIRQSILPGLIQELVSERLPNWTNTGMNIFELFYSNISGIDLILIYTLSKLTHNQTSVQVDSLVKLQDLIEGSAIFLKIIKSYSIDMLPNPITPTTNNSNSCHNLLKRLIGLIVTFLEGEFKSIPANKRGNGDTSLVNISESALYDQLFNLTNVYLKSLSENYHELFDQSKTTVIEPFVSSGRYHLAFTLADTFDDYQTIVNIYLVDIDNRESQLEVLHNSIRKFQTNHPQLLESIFEYMISNHMEKELLQLPQEFNNELTQFLERYPSLSWINFIRMKQWSQTSSVLFKESLIEKENLSTKKTLLSLSKIALLADKNTKFPNEDLNVINQSLSLIKNQKEFIPNEKRILSVFELVELVLLQHNIESMDKYLIALNFVLESSNLIAPQDKLNLIRHILSVALDNESFINLAMNPADSDLQLDLTLSNSDFFQLLLKLPNEKSIRDLVYNVMDEYFKEKSKLINDPQLNRQFQINFTRIAELYKLDASKKQ
eukprot:gene4549-5667_t